MLGVDGDGGRRSGFDSGRRAAQTGTEWGGGGGGRSCAALGAKDRAGAARVIGTAAGDGSARARIDPRVRKEKGKKGYGSAGIRTARERDGRGSPTADAWRRRRRRGVTEWARVRFTGEHSNRV